MNVLLTSVGRRAYMVKYFKKEIGEDGTVVVTNSDCNSVAFKYADKTYVSPLIYDKEYIPFLLEICKNENIDLLISLFDIDLLILSQNIDLFNKIGTKVIVSSEEVIKICNDKWETYCFLKNNRFNAPKTYLNIKDVLLALRNKELFYPLIIKPRFGCGSISIEIANNDEELMFYSKIMPPKILNTYLKYESQKHDDVLIYQEYICGQEYGADIINDLDGTFVNSIIRKKLAMRSGETDIAEIVEDNMIKKQLSKLGNTLKHVGNLDCDFFVKDGDVYFLEFNARFGGGYPFSYEAGCNLPKAIVSWLNGKNVDKSILDIKRKGIFYKEITIV